MIDLTTPRSIHVVGAGGAGMSAIASVLAAMGHEVTGSDLKESRAVERLGAAGVHVQVGHRADQVGEVDLVTVSSAIPEHNVEVRAAKERGIPVLRRSEILAAITGTRNAISVAGTHGKTTTSSMLALILAEAGRQPSFIVGGDINEVGSGAAWDDGTELVVEADESDGTFLELDTHLAVVTNVEPDHLEHYDGWSGLRSAFDRFVGGSRLRPVVGVDDPDGAELAAAHDAITVGTAPGARFHITDIESLRAGVRFSLEEDGRDLGRFELPVPGTHNARNAAIATAAAMAVGVAADTARAALARFAGVARRFEFRGQAGGVSFVDDYAHLPTEVAAAIATAVGGGWKRVVVAFQPHRFSRTAALWDEFAHAFEGADLLAVTDVYPSGEAPRPGISGKLIVNAVLDAHPWQRVAYLPSRADLRRYLLATLTPGDLCLTLNAGDLTSLVDELIEALDQPTLAAVT